jgi:hypothetical protein
MTGIPDFKRDAVGLGELKEAGVGDVGAVEENILLAAGLDESVVFLFVEKFNGAFLHGLPSNGPNKFKRTAEPFLTLP